MAEGTGIYKSQADVEYAEPATEPEVQRELGRLHHTLKDIGEAVESMEKALGPVLAPATEKDTVPHDLQEVVQSSLAVRIVDMNGSARFALNRLRDTLARVRV